MRTIEGKLNCHPNPKTTEFSQSLTISSEIHDRPASLSIPRASRRFLGRRKRSSRFSLFDSFLSIDQRISPSRVAGMRHFIVNSLSIFMLALPVMSEPLIRIGEEWRYLLATEAPSNPPDLWRQLHYDDSNWLSGTSGFYSGFGVVREATPIFGLGIDSSTVLFRKTFHVESPESILWPILRLDYQHGFAAYLNGQPPIPRPSCPR
jgi:hypothetical protein